MDTQDTNDFQRLFSELQTVVPSLTAWTYIAMWAFSDMYQRMKANPEDPRFHEILFPHTKVPLFTKAEAKHLQNAWKNSTHSFTAAAAQMGGAFPFPPSKQDAKKAAKFAGQALGTVVAGVDPETFSLDKQYEYVTQTLDAVDSQLTDFSKQYGLVALESVAPDPKFVLPLGPVPIPIVIPVKTVLPTVNLILELFRIVSTQIPVVSFLGTPATLLMTLLDLARGNFYHAMFSLIGIFGKYPMYAGIGLKILRDAYLLISPNLRSDLRDVVFKSSKSFAVGFMIWMFATVAPDIIRKPIVMLLDKVRLLVENFNDVMTKAEVKATAAMKGFGSVELPKLPSDKIPSIGDLYILQEYIQNPRVYCHPDIDGIIQEMRSIPPMALFFDLLNIPRKGTPEYVEACSRVETVPLADEFMPKITLVNPVTKAPVPNTPIPAPPGTEPAISV